MRQARIFIDLIGTEGEMDRAGQSFNIRKLCDCLDEAKEWAKNLDKKYPNMGWTYVVGDKYLIDGESVNIHAPLTTVTFYKKNPQEEQSKIDGLIEVLRDLYTSCTGVLPLKGSIKITDTPETANDLYESMEKAEKALEAFEGGAKR